MNIDLDEVMSNGLTKRQMMDAENTQTNETAVKTRSHEDALEITITIAVWACFSIAIIFGLMGIDSFTNGAIVEAVIALITAGTTAISGIVFMSIKAIIKLLKDIRDK